VLVGVLFDPGSAYPQIDTDAAAIARIRDEGFNGSQVMEYAWYLTDVIGPRLSGSSNMRQSQEWAKDQMGSVLPKLRPSTNRKAL
jgi:hypothetical protein